METLIKLIDEFIDKDSFLITDNEMDSAMSNWNKLFDIANSEQEKSDIDQMKYENERSADGLLKKQEKDENGKNKYTDKTLEMQLEIEYADKEIYFITNKYKFKVIPNKLKVLEHKINWVKKIKGI